MITQRNPRPEQPRAHPWIGLALAALIPLSTQAQDVADGAGTAEFQYIETLVFARPAGLAGAYTSLAQGMDAVGYNPAGLSRLGARRSVSGTMRYHFLDVTSGNVTYAFPGMGAEVSAFSVSYINYGRIKEIDEEGFDTGRKLLPSSFNPSFTWSRRASNSYRMGMTVKGFTEYLGDFEGSELALGWGVDLGLLYQPSVKNMGFGLTLLNAGRKERPHFTGGKSGGLLPASLKGGFFYQPTDVPKARFVADVEAPWNDAPLLSGGLEYAYSPNLTLRGGSRISHTEAIHYYKTVTDQRPEDFQDGNALKAAGGFTFEVEGVAMDYAVQYWNGLNWVHAATLRYPLL